MPPNSHPLVYVVPDASALFEECEDRMSRLRSEGFDVCVAAPAGEGLDAFAYHGFRIRPLPGKADWNIAGWVGAYLILQAEFLENRPTLVHGFGMPWAWLTAFAAHQAEVPATFATIEQHDFTRDKSTLRRLLSALPDALSDRVGDNRGAYRLLGKWVDGYLTHHEEDLRLLSERGIVPTAKLELILGGSGVDMIRYDVFDEELPDKQRARVLQGVPPRVRTLVGIAGPWNKRTLRRFRALERELARTHPGLGFLLAGAPGETPAKRVAEATPTFYRSLDVYLDLDERDSNGEELMQAAAMRVPVVAVNSPAARTVIVDFETGRIAEPDELKDVLVEVIGDPKRASDMGIRARARAEHRFDRQQIDEQILGIYDRILTRTMG